MTNLNTIKSSFDSPVSLSELYNYYKTLSKLDDNLQMGSVLPKELLRLCKDYPDAEGFYFTDRKLKQDLPIISLSQVRAKLEIVAAAVEGDRFSVNFQVNISAPVTPEGSLAKYSVDPNSQNSRWFNLKLLRRNKLNISSLFVDSYVENKIFTREMIDQLVEHSKWFLEVESQEPGSYYTKGNAKYRLNLAGPNLTMLVRPCISILRKRNGSINIDVGTQISAAEVEFVNATSFGGYISPNSQLSLMVAGEQPKALKLEGQKASASVNLNLEELDDEEDVY